MFRSLLTNVYYDILCNVLICIEKMLTFITNLGLRFMAYYSEAALLTEAF